jgi:putative ABC transport system permease protein
MRIRDLFYLVGGNLWRMKARVSMTVAGVLIGAAAIILLIALGLGMQHSFTENLGRVGDLTSMMVRVPTICTAPERERPTACQGLRVEDELVERIRKMPGVSAAAPQVLMKSMPTYLRYQNMEATAVVVGVDPGLIGTLGYPLARGQMVISPNQVVMGPKAAEYMFDMKKKESVTPRIDYLGEWVELIIQRQPASENPEFGSNEASSVETRRLRVQVAGVLGETGGPSDHMIYYPLCEVDRWNRWLLGRQIRRNVEGYDQVVVKVEDIQVAASVDEAITAMGYSVDTARRMIEQFNRFFISIQLMLGGIGTVALLVSAFGIANTMIMAIYERTREIGLLKSLGARNADVMLLFLTEAATIGLLGGFCGVLLALGLGNFLNDLGPGFMMQFSGMMGPPGSGIPGLGGSTVLYIPSWLVFFAVGFTVLVGILSGVYPAARAASLDPLEALRHE